MTLGQRYHTLKCLDVGKCHTKFQLSSPEGIKVISCKRNADVNLHLNLQVSLNLVTNVTYARTDVTSLRNAICPTPAKGKRGHKKSKLLSAALVTDTLMVNSDQIYGEFRAAMKLTSVHVLDSPQCCSGLNALLFMIKALLSAALFFTL